MSGVAFPFLKTGCKVFAGLTPLSYGSMRFRWGETNANRIAFFSAPCFRRKTPVSVELIHSRRVIAVDTAEHACMQTCDGIISCNAFLLPVITVADCMPVFMYEPKSGCFGVLHSGWKGTGIVLEALYRAEKEYGTHTADFRFILGPSIGSCCYTVDEERALFFQKEFSSDCVSRVGGTNRPVSPISDSGFYVSNAPQSGKLYSLSLEKANRALLIKAGVKNEHIYSILECTCCTKTEGKYVYGSFRRQTASLSSMPLEEKQRHFTPMAAFIGCTDEYFTPENLCASGVHTYFFP